MCVCVYFRVSRLLLLCQGQQSSHCVLLHKQHPGNGVLALPSMEAAAAAGGGPGTHSLVLRSEPLVDKINRPWKHTISKPLGSVLICETAKGDRGSRKIKHKRLRWNEEEEEEEAETYRIQTSNTQKRFYSPLFIFGNNSSLNSDKGRRNQASRVAGKLRFFRRNFENPPWS